MNFYPYFNKRAYQIQCILTDLQNTYSLLKYITLITLFYIFAFLHLHIF